MDNIIELLIDSHRAMTMTLAPDSRDVLITIYKPYSDEEEKEFYGKSLEKVLYDAESYLESVITIN